MSEEENKTQKRTTRVALKSAHKQMTKALEQTNATLGMQSHYDRAITHIAKQFGVQPRDLKFCMEVEIEFGAGGQVVNEEILDTFMGFEDPSPNPDEKGKIISFDEALKRTWKPAR